MALPALVHHPAGIHWHRFGLMISALWTAYGGFQLGAYSHCSCSISSCMAVRRILTCFHKGSGTHENNFLLCMPGFLLSNFHGTTYNL